MTDNRTQPTLHVQQVSKSFNSTTALSNVELRIEPGSVRALLGANGAGKTTLISIIAGVLTPDAGRVMIAGIDSGQRPAEASTCFGWAPQELAVYPTLTVRENLGYIGVLMGLKGNTLKRRTDETIEALGLEQLLDKQARFMSGGEQRRLHTGMALLHRPPLLLLDEPTVGVDAQTRSQLIDLVRQLAQSGQAVLYTSHYIEEIESLGADVSILSQGRIVAEGSQAAIIERFGQASIRVELDQPVHTFLGVDALDRHAVVPCVDMASTLMQIAAEATLLNVGIAHIDVTQSSLEASFLAAVEQDNGQGVANPGVAAQAPRTPQLVRN